VTYGTLYLLSLKEEKRNYDSGFEST